MSQIDKKILSRIKSAYNIKTDSDLADFLGVKHNTISTWKRRNSYNLELILSKCEDLNANWLLYGQGERFKNGQNRMAQEPNRDYIAKTYWTTDDKKEFEELLNALKTDDNMPFDLKLTAIRTFIEMKKQQTG